MAYDSTPSLKPPRIGVFIGRVDDSFQRTIWKSIVARARERGAEAIGFFGHGLGSPVPSQATMNVVYRMASPRCLDGLIVLSNTVGNFEDPARVASLVAGTGLPAVSMQFDLGGLSYVRTRGGPAMAELVRHLARSHGRRRFALVTGPRRHGDSIEREAAFREALAAEGIAFDERLLFEGRFFKESGEDAVRRFLDSGLDFDALVCLNDFMAFGALEALRERGVDVPGRVSVTGFDDVAEARWAGPPLTTVHQPLEALGAEALDLALELLAGGTTGLGEARGGPRSLDCACVFRRSCGCPPEPLLPPSGHAEAGDAAELRLAGELASLASRGELHGLLALLDRELSARQGEPGGAEELRRLLYAARARGGGFPKAAAQASPGFDCFDQGLALIAEAELRWEIEDKLRIAERSSFIRELGMRILGTFSLEALVRQWESCLGPMGVARSYLVLFEAPVPPLGVALPPRSRLVRPSASPGGGVSELQFPTACLLPPELGIVWGPAGWIIEPLVYQDEALGYLLVESGTEEPLVYESLRDQMSAAVKATLLMEEIEENRRSLERLVERRTEELRNANRGLKAQIAQRRILEREVQEIGNRTMQAIGQDIHDDLCQQLAGISMLAAALEDGLSSGAGDPQDSIAAALGSAREIRGLLEGAVDRSRQFARTLYPPGLVERGLVLALEELCASLGRASAGTGAVHSAGPSISFQAEGDCGIADQAKALQLYRIVQEALSNALRHSGSEVIMLRLLRREGRLVAEVRDFGRGMGPTKAQGRGMGLRIMRYRADSIGARLEIRNLEPGVCVSCSLE
jgi:DNA-binding LacI/PurR family transcriptional regulator/signal transduction histidine kinase